ncbi:hypothetical protein [Photobacterium damselae]|uniref:hypothetical protein n=1 Tax=Photobacterium damselae TaxID=38293 RepID=UPI001F3049C9|nr:hypothetical protein [Photobacterium damselae]UKA12859.1 hypothetical protein IHC91_20935 [Photobacterium damselae subsp. damselae]
MNNKHWSITKKTFQDLSKEAPLVSSLIDFTQWVIGKEASKSQKDLIKSLLTANCAFEHADSYHIVSPKVEFNSKHFQSMVDEMRSAIREADEIKLHRWLLNACAHFEISSIEEARAKDIILIKSACIPPLRFNRQHDMYDPEKPYQYMLVELTPTGPVILTKCK